MGASWVRTHILDAHPNAKLSVFVVWLPMLAGDARSAWDDNVLDDPRVREFWDGDRVVGHWFGEQELGGLGGPGVTVWDAFYAFPSGSRWKRRPNELIVAGSDIIDNVSRLEASFVPLLYG